jgi:hypothetical protein
MSIYATLYDNRREKHYDISQAISDLQITTKIKDDPGKASFKLVNQQSDIRFSEGATVSIKLDGEKMFRGFVFARKRNKETNIPELTCYDQLRYLKNKDSYVFENMSSDQIFSRICSDNVLNYKIVDTSSYKCAPRSNDAVSYYEMIKNAFDDTLINSRKWFIVRDNYGVLEHVNITSLQPGIMLGDASGILDFSYESSIDKDTYNQIKLYRDNKTTGKREIFIVNDTINGGGNLKAWGILQLYEQVDEGLNLSQIEQKGRGMLALYNNVKRTLSINSIGVPKMCAGSIFKCSIADLGDTSINNYLLVTSCTHKISNNEHTMDLETEVVSNVS